MSIINVDLNKRSNGNKQTILFKKEEYILTENNQNVFTLSYEIQENSETVHLNGLLLKSKHPNSDYNISNQTLNINIETHVSDLITIAYATTAQSSN